MKRIAVVGMACIYPDARSPIELWENVLARRRAFRRMPSERLRSEDYLSSDRNAPDMTYSTQAAVIEGYEFDRERFHVVGSTFRSADLAHWLALDVASQALADAGLHDSGWLPKESTGVLVGNTLTGEFSRAAVMRLRWPYVSRVVNAKLADEGWSLEKRASFLKGLEVLYKIPFPEAGDETLAGGLSNTIAGRICNYFDFKGGGYTVDGACSSSLLAISNACSALQAGDLDIALAGGVDLSLDPFELVGFSRIGALASGEMRVYDRNPTGFLPGEGCGFVVLMRYEDALAHNLRCYAKVQGWGISSDGAGGITRPEMEGQRLALERAYRSAGYGIDTVELFEGHGTGTVVGDEIELRALSTERRDAHARTPAVIGSIKANIGHTKAAAGVAGFIKAVMSLDKQILPPTTGVLNRHPELEGESPALIVLEEGRAWPQDRPLRVGVSSFGFGGINVHVTIEGSEAEHSRQLESYKLNLLSIYQDAELFLLGAENQTGLYSQAERLQALAPHLSYAELSDLAVSLANDPGPFEARAAVVASSPDELTINLKTLLDWLEGGVVKHIDPLSGTSLGSGEETPRIAFLFPGQASPVRLNGGTVGRRFSRIRELYARAPLELGGDLISTAVAQPAIITAELAGLLLMELLGVEASTSLGHSVGELAAMYWAGALDEDALLHIAKVRGDVMSKVPGPAGAMASIGAGHLEVEELLSLSAGPDDRRVVIACMNLPDQTVISGEARAVERLVVRAREEGKTATPLPVSHAFHSSLMEPAAEALEAHLLTEDFRPLRRGFISTITGRAIHIDEEEDLRELLKHQLTSPVRFTEAMAGILEGTDLCIEVGPGRVLTGLLKGWVDIPAISLDIAGKSLRGILQGVGAAYALGTPIHRDVLFRDRFSRPFDQDRKPKFFVNPCERAPLHESGAITSLQAPLSPVSEPEPQILQEISGRFTSKVSEADTLELVRQIVAQRAELPITAVKDESRLLKDLHLNSISVSQIVGEAARHLGLPPPAAPTDYSTATLAQVAQALDDLLSSGVTEAEEVDRFPPGVDSWVRTYTVEMVEHPLETRQKSLEGRGDWQVFASPGHPLAQPLGKGLEALGGSGVLVCLPAEPDESQIGILLEGARAVLANEGSPRYFVLVQHGSGAASFARTLHLEATGLTTCVVDIPLVDTMSSNVCDWVLAEVQNAGGYNEAGYDTAGRRWKPVLRLLSLEEMNEEAPLGPADVLLVSGGGKGIAAECAAVLARETGVRLALLGRSRPEEDEELAANLDRLSDSGITFRYLSVDVTDSDAVKEAVMAAETEFGPVTSILHGAGINRPQMLHTLNETDFQCTLSAKVQGLRNLLSAVDPERLRLLVAFGSIIARTGMRGEADYALANEWLTRLTEEFQLEHPDCRCLSVEWSVWSGVGMGERLGRVDALIREGIIPIPPDRGISILRSLIAMRLPAAAVVVTGRLGDVPTLNMESSELPFLRFLEQPRVYYPGVELVTDAEVSNNSDPYLEDHVFKGERLFPAVMGLEAMAQAAMAVTGEAGAPVFEDVSFLRPVVVDQGKHVTLRIAALVSSPGLVEVVLRCGETAFQVDHFRAVCHFGTQEDTSLSQLLPELTSLSVPVNPLSDLYGGLLFQKGRFKRLNSYHWLAAKECCAGISAGDSVAWFARYLPNKTIMGDPGSRDAAIHAIQACIPHAVLLPVGVERIVPVALHIPGPWIVHARERLREGDIFVYDLDMRGMDGSLRERWEGLRLRKVEDATNREWLEALLPPFVERRVEELIPGAGLTVVLEKDAGAGRRVRSDHAMQHALGYSVKIHRRADGKPETEGEREVSAAHAGDLTLAVAGSRNGSIACDLEPVVARQEREWRDLVGAEHTDLIELILQETGEDREAAATRVWTAMECLKKAGAMLNTPLVLQASPDDGWVLLGAGDYIIATYVAVVTDKPAPLTMAFLVSKPHALP